MAGTSVILRPDINRAPQVAQGVLCVLAAACVAAAAVGLSSRKTDAAKAVAPRDAELARAEAAMLRTMVPAPQTPSVGSPSVQMLLPQTSQPSFPPAPGPGLTTTPPAPASPSLRGSPSPAAPVRPEPPKPTLPLEKQLKNPQAMEAVMAARALRSQGDVIGAINLLKTADQKEPNHPEIIGEMALSYEEMGVTSAAEPLWRQIYTMGEATAGGYYTLAAAKIGARTQGAAPAQGSSVPVPVTLGACRLSREPLTNQGERISLHVPIGANPGATIDPSKLEIHVTLYESVNGGARVEAVPRDKAAQKWSTPPLNWAEPGGEAVEVTYDLFTQRPGSADTRSFHGYSVKLYYQNKLAGEQAQPPSLRNATQKSATPAGLDNALFPK